MKEVEWRVRPDHRRVRPCDDHDTKVPQIVLRSREQRTQPLRLAARVRARRRRDENVDADLAVAEVRRVGDANAAEQLVAGAVHVFVRGGVGTAAATLAVLVAARLRQRGGHRDLEIEVLLVGRDQRVPEGGKRALEGAHEADEDDEGALARRHGATRAAASCEIGAVAAGRAPISTSPRPRECIASNLSFIIPTMLRLICPCTHATGESRVKEWAALLGA